MTAWATEDNLRTVYEYMRNTAHKAGFLTDQEMGDKVVRHKIMTELVSDFERGSTKVRDYPSGAKALSAFKEYLTTRQQLPIRDDFMQKLSLSVTVHYGAVSLTIGIEDEFYCPDQTARQAIMKAMRESIDDLHREQARSLHQAAPQQPAEPKEQVTDRIEIEAIRRERVKGKDRWRVIGGNYKEFGVPIYEEAAERSGISLQDFDEDDTPVKGHAIIARRPNGNPLKVLELVLQ